MQEYLNSIHKYSTPFTFCSDHNNYRTAHTQKVNTFAAIFLIGNLL